MHRVIAWADGVECVVPACQQLPGLGIKVAPARLVPDRQPVTVEPDVPSGGPPDLVVGGGDDLPQLGAGDGAAHRAMECGASPLLPFDGGEVLHVAIRTGAKTAAKRPEWGRLGRL